MNLKHRHTCRVCGNPHLKEVIDLGDQYLQGSFVKPGMTEPTTRKIPTKLVRCDVSKGEGACGLVQTTVSVPPQVLYSNYWYQSAISKTMRDHLKSIAEEGMSYVPRPSRVLDIAANDGTLLSFYPAMTSEYHAARAPYNGPDGCDSGCEAYYHEINIIRTAIDPSDIARKIVGAIVINDTFPSSKMSAAPSDYLRFDIITSIAMFYDVEDPVTFVKAIKAQLRTGGVWIVEIAYLPATLSQVSYDTIVHEHLLYYSLATLEEVFKRGGMRCIKATTNDINGGSIRCVVVHDDCFLHDKQEDLNALNGLRVREFDLGLDTDKPYDLFRSKVVLQKHELMTLIAKIKSEGGVIHLYGASTKANTLLQYCGLDHVTIPYAWERSSEKCGGKTLGTGIRMISEEEGRAMKPDYVLVGPWHFKREIIERERDTINGGCRFIFPLPTIEVVDHA
jgi:hypothetical protein